MRRLIRILLFIFLIAGAALAATFLTLHPSNNRQWEPAHAVLPHVIINGNDITIHNLRSFRYRTESDYDINYRDVSFPLTDIQGVDFVVEPFYNFKPFAHTMVSFRLASGDNITISIEARREQGEPWDAKRGLVRQYELMYIIADEPDAVYLRTNIRHDQVYLYPTIATPEQAQALFLEMADNTNKLYTHPEFYNILTNNCTTRLVENVNTIAPKPIKFSWRYVLPGYATSLAYDLGLLGTDHSLSELESRSQINAKADGVTDLDMYSKQIRSSATK
ncbi:MAG: DUF4105 domain-containing protein [Candidatus Buchananbacteria bacterium]|nr:DUF4105 domain-containing protein [Candidatus Buchananbacteria bacterium]